MAGAPAREQALSLLAAANNHGDLAVKLSSLKQAKDILLSVEPSQASELFPYLVELQSSPETLVRKYLLEVIDEIGAKTREHLSILLPVLLTYLKDNNPVVAKQSIITGTKFFCIVLEELAFQFQRRGIVERWLEELWTWMIKFRDAVLGIIFEVGSVGPKLLAIKFLETYVLYFTLDSNDFGTYNPEVMIRQGRVFNVSWIMDGHPVLDPPALISDANRYLGILMDMLRSASNFPGSLTIAAVNSCGMNRIGFEGCIFRLELLCFMQTISRNQLNPLNNSVVNILIHVQEAALQSYHECSAKLDNIATIYLLHLWK